MNRLLPAVALLATAVPFQANASGNYEYPYSGIGGGTASLDDTCDGAGSICDDETSFFRVYSGARLLSNFGMEVGYTQTQDFELINASRVPNLDLSLRGLDVTGLIHLPVSSRFDVFAKVGGFFWEAEAEATGIGSGDETGSDFRTGVGAQMGITENLYIRADYDYIPNVDYSNGALDEDDLSLISGSIQYHF